MIAILASVAALISGAMSPPDTGPKLTRKIARGSLLVTTTEQGLVESSENDEIKCQVRGRNTVIWVIENGSMVEPGDVLVRLGTLYIEEQIDERTKYANWSQSAADYTKAAVTAAELALAQYEQGQYVSELMTLEKNFTVAESRLKSAKSMFRYAELMKQNRYVSELEVDEKRFAVRQAEMSLDVLKTQLDVLKRFTKAERLQRLNGDLAAVKANHKANVERAMADASRRDRALEEYKHCVVRAERGGLVIHPSAAQWENAPEIAEGKTVYKNQVLLLMPDLSKMQVKVGIHESVIDRVKPGLTAKVTLPDMTLTGTVSEVASVTRPAGWWTGNEVRYDTIVELPSVKGLRPGMSAEVEVLIARHENVLRIPVAAVVESNSGSFCWIKTPRGPERRTLKLGDSNSVYSVVEAGLQEGDEVLLNPLGLPEAQTIAKQTGEKKTQQPSSIDPVGEP